MTLSRKHLEREKRRDMEVPNFRDKIDRSDLEFKGDVSKEDLGLINGGKKFQSIDSAMRFVDAHFSEEKLKKAARDRSLPVTYYSPQDRLKLLESLSIYLPTSSMKTIYRMMIRGANRNVMAIALKISYEQLVTIEEKCVEIIDNVLAKNDLGNPIVGSLS